MRKILILVIALLIVGALAQTIFSEEDTIGEKIGNRIFVSNTLTFIQVTPHTLTSDGFVEIEFLSKQLTGDVDFAIGINTQSTEIRSIEFLTDAIINGTISKTWVSAKINTFNEFYDNKNYWHYATNIPIITNKTYKVRVYFAINGAGKYDIVIKPSSETFSESKSNNNLLLLDPWWNSSSGSINYTNGMLTGKNVVRFGIWNTTQGLIMVIGDWASSPKVQGMKWNGSKWIYNASIFPDTTSGGYPYMSAGMIGNDYALIYNKVGDGSAWNSGYARGYNWTPAGFVAFTAWDVTSTHYVASGDIFTFCDETTYHHLYIYSTGASVKLLVGRTWNGSAFRDNSSILTGLGSINNTPSGVGISSIEIYCDTVVDKTFMIVTNDSNEKNIGFMWNSTSWVRNDTHLANVSNGTSTLYMDSEVWSNGTSTFLTQVYGLADYTPVYQQYIWQLLGSEENSTKAIEEGIASSEIGGLATTYTDKQIYLANTTNQVTGTVDRVVTYGNHRYMFNLYEDTAVGLFNMTPRVYVMEIQLETLSFTEIKNRVSKYINDTYP